jgi:hypothetical protein
MANKRIIELDVTDVVENDDFLAIDSVSGKTRRIKPIKIGATYEIEDGVHSFTLVGSNGYSHTVDIPYDSVSMTQAEYDALTPEQQADGTARFITDGESDVESELWSKVGRQTLDTDAQVLTNAVNELKGDIDTNTDAISELNSNKADSILVRDVACNSFGTISANSVFEITANVAYSGYTPLGVVGYNFNDTSCKISITGTRIIGSTASILGRTLDSGIIDTDSATIRILYIKN